jgi:inorganic triphosphatase YgiF
MEELARIHHKDIDVSAHQVLLAFSAMRKIVTVINRLVQSAQCAEMSQESAILAVSVEPDIKVRNVTSLLILASQILAAMEPNANSYNKEDFSAIVKKAGRDLYVTSILMTVKSNHVLLEQTVQT